MKKSQFQSAILFLVLAAAAGFGLLCLGLFEWFGLGLAEWQPASLVELREERLRAKY